jgi:hypothetical protein
MLVARVPATDLTGRVGAGGAGSGAGGIHLGKRAPSGAGQRRFSAKSIADCTPGHRRRGQRPLAPTSSSPFPLGKYQT